MESGPVIPTAPVIPRPDFDSHDVLQAGKPMLMYLNYGPGGHVQETMFSIMSALRHLDAAQARERIVVYTDSPGDFRHLPVGVEPIGQPELDSWIAGTGYVHRRKTASIIHALQKYKCPMAFVDSDTWFIKSPAMIFARVAPGRTCMHLRETRLLEARGGARRSLSEFLQHEPITDTHGNRMTFQPNEDCWNSGVLALHPDDAPLLVESLNLMDQIWAGFKDTHDLEQFATGVILGRRTQISETKDVVFHYWPSHLREPFREALPDILRQSSTGVLKEDLQVAYGHRPRIGGTRLVRQIAKEMIRNAGIPLPGIRTSG